MPDCFLHVGGPKTGSTAIQEALFYHIHDPRFQYVSGGEPNGTLAVSALFDDFPRCEKIFRRFGSPGGSFAAYQSRFARQWTRGVERAVRYGRHIIISAEILWVLPQPVLERLRDSIVSRGFDIHVRGYVRPWHAWLTSLCVHQFVHDRGRFVLTSPWDELNFQVVANVHRLRRVFGHDRCQIFLFDPGSFPGECVVRHFAARVGLRFPEGFALRANEGFSRRAVQLAYCYHKFENPVGEEDLDYPAGKFRMLAMIRQLSGPPLRFHPELLAPWRHQQKEQDSWIERELCFSLDDPPPDGTIDGAIRRESDLFEFDPQTLDWLGRMTGQRVIRDRFGEQAARQVARQVSMLRFRWLSAGEIRSGIGLIAKKGWARAWYGR